MNRQQRIS